MGAKDLRKLAVNGLAHAAKMRANPLASKMRAATLRPFIRAEHEILDETCSHSRFRPTTAASECRRDLYSGTCRNVTFGIDGLLKLFIVETDKGLDGYMSISGFLFGSGPLKGTRDGNTFKFTPRRARADPALTGRARCMALGFRENTFAFPTPRMA